MIGLSVIVGATAVFFAGVSGIKDALQTLDYFLLAYMVFAFHKRGLERLPWIIIGLGIAAAGVALIQLVKHPDQSFAASSFYENRNVFGLVMAVLIPSILAIAIAKKQIRIKISLFSLALLSLVVTTSPQAMVALVLTGVILSIASSQGRVVWVALCLSGIGLLAVRSGELRGVFEPRHLAGYHQRLERRALMAAKSPLLTSNFGGRTITISMPRSAAAPADHGVEGVVSIWRRDLLFGDGHHLLQEVIEANAGLTLFVENPLLGCGPGLYQDLVSEHYGNAPKLNSMEPDTQSGFIVHAATTGSLGTALLLSVIAIPIAFGWRRCRQGDLSSFALAGALGFLMAALVLPAPQRPEGVILIIALIAYARVCGTTIPKKASGPSVAQSPEAGMGKDSPAPRDERTNGKVGKGKSLPKQTPGDRLGKRNVREAIVTVLIALAVISLAIPVLHESVGPTSGQKGGLVKAAPLLIVVLGLVVWALFNRWHDALRGVAPFALGWVFGSVAHITVPLKLSEAHRLEIAPVLLGLALLIIAKFYSAGDPRKTAPQLLWKVVLVHIVGMCALVLLWLVLHNLYGDSWRNLLDRLWPLGAVAVVLLLGHSLMTTNVRARTAMVCTALVLLFMGLVRGSVV
jgi:hypothetical protein